LFKHVFTILIIGGIHIYNCNVHAYLGNNKKYSHKIPLITRIVIRIKTHGEGRVGVYCTVEVYVTPAAIDGITPCKTSCSPDTDVILREIGAFNS